MFFNAVETEVCSEILEDNAPEQRYWGWGICGILFVGPRIEVGNEIRDKCQKYIYI